MARLTHISVDTGRSRKFIGMDVDGDVWHGEIKTDKSGQEYIEWIRLRSEFKEKGS
jgi:hypothetical protein